MKTKRSKKPLKAVPFKTLTGQYLTDLAIACEEGKKSAVTKARNNLANIGIQVFLGAPVPELAANDIKVATTGEIIAELKRRLPALIVCGFKYIGAEEEWHEHIQGSHVIACAVYNKVSIKFKEHLNKGDSNAATPIQNS